MTVHILCNLKVERRGKKILNLISKLEKLELNVSVGNKHLVVKCFDRQRLKVLLKSMKN